jgi:hypothetical protein
MLAGKLAGLGALTFVQYIARPDGLKRFNWRLKSHSIGSSGPFGSFGSFGTLGMYMINR